MTDTQRPAAESSPLPTWAGVKNSEKLESMVIHIEAYDFTNDKGWIKAELEPSHWTRLVSIAETPADKISPQGFSWVSLVQIDGQIIELAPPAHLAALTSTE